MNKRGEYYLIIPFILSITITIFLFFLYPEMVEDTAEGLIRAGALPERFHSSDGWIVDYAPVEHFIILSIVFVLLYYVWSLLQKRGNLIQKSLIGIYCVGYIFTLVEFWQMIGVTLVPMILITGLAIRCILKQSAD